MEDRTRLFHLIQMVKTLDFEHEHHDDDDDCNSDFSDEDFPFADNGIACVLCGDSDSGTFSEPSSVCRRLDFSCETSDHHQKQFSCQLGSAHGSHNRNTDPGQSKVSSLPVHLEFNTGSAVLCSNKPNSNHRSHAHSHQCGRHPGAKTKANNMERKSIQSSHTKLVPSCASSQKPKLRSGEVTVMSNNKQVRYRDRKGISKKEKQFRSRATSGHMTAATPVFESKTTAGYNYGVPLSSPPPTHKKQPVRRRISVCVRKRPLTRAEWKRREADVVTTLSGESVVVHGNKEAVDLTQYILQHRFYFDQVFGEESTNEEVYRRTAYPLVQHMLHGGSATCFAYGQTGAGKTHTMLGSSSGIPGLYVMAVRDIFTHLSDTQTHSQLLVYVSFFEIYCGQLYDLLDHRKRLFAREDRQKVVHIAGLRDVRVDSIDSLLEVISQGTAERTQGMSGVNPISSRSHAMLQIQLRGPDQQMAGRIWFVDLAGSERASDTKEPGRQSRIEAAEINQSLLALKECIRSLDQEQSHTPFRQSKLTQVLKDSFVGNSMTCMIANISPGHSATEHTLNTLRYADRVKELRGKEAKRIRRGKNMPSPKHNLFFNNSSSETCSVRIQGKSPPKRQKLGRHREACFPAVSTMSLTTEGPVLSSTPQNSRWEDKTSARNGSGQITPIRGFLGICDKREKKGRAGRREGRRRETPGKTDRAEHSNHDQNVRAGMVMGQANHEEGESERESWWIEERGHLENRRGSSSETERLREIHLRKVDEREKRRHLRKYHQQLQQFMPSSACSSDYVFSHSMSFSSSNRDSPYSSPFPQHRSHISVPALMYHDCERDLDVYRDEVEVGPADNRGQLISFPSGELCLQTDTSPRHNKSNDEVGHGDIGSNSEDLRACTEDKKAAYEQDKSESVKRRSLKATDEGEIRNRGREKEQTDMMTDARRADVEAPGAYSCDSMVVEERSDASDAPYGMDHPLAESPHQQAPAEQPLSTAYEYTNAPLTPYSLSDHCLELKHSGCTSKTMPLSLQNAQGLSSTICGEKEPWISANTNTSEFLKAHLVTLPLTTPIMHNRCKISAEPPNILSENTADAKVHSHPEVSAEMDQQVSTSSILQSNSLFRPLENGREGGKKMEVGKEHLPCLETAEKIVEIEDVEFCLSPPEVLQAKTKSPPTSGTMAVTDHPEQRRDDQENRQTLKTTPVTEVVNNNPPKSLFKPSTFASTEPSSMQSISSSVQHCGNTGSSNSPPEYADYVCNNLAFFISKQQSENFPGQDILPKQRYTMHSNHSSNMSLQPNSAAESNSEASTTSLQIRPTIHLSTLEDLYHAQWCVVEAHWEQLEEMETLFREEGTLLYQQPDMEFEEYVRKLGEIMERKARCVHGMIARLQPYLENSHPHNEGEDNPDQIT